MTTGNKRPALSRVKEAERKTRHLEEILRQTMIQEVDWLHRATEILAKSAGDLDGKA